MSRGVAQGKIGQTLASMAHMQLSHVLTCTEMVLVRARVDHVETDTHRDAPNPLNHFRLELHRVQLTQHVKL